VVDRSLLQRKLRDLQRYVREVSEFREIDPAQYRQDWKSQRIVERTLQLAIEVCADVAAHVIADRSLRAPSTYAEAFEVLGEAGLLEPDLRDVLVRMARFRNLVVHESRGSTPIWWCAFSASTSPTSRGSAAPPSAGSGPTESPFRASC
jgi:uncharacterized protein YutE (UPF0331/DUF86 family)